MPRSFEPKPNNPALTQLVQLHAQLGGKLLSTKREADKIAEDMLAVEACIRLFDPDYDVRRIAVKRKNATGLLFKKGMVYREVLDILRASGEPMTARQVATRMLANKGFAQPAVGILKAAINSVHHALKGQRGKTVEAVDADGGALWRIGAQ